MHWNFAKLQLNALALRGLSPRQAHLISDQRRDFANLAIARALGTLSFILEDTSIRNSIQGVPLYLHTMVTYASIFLLRVQMRWRPARLNVSISLVLALIERISQLLGQAYASERHLSFHVANGLVQMLVKFKEVEHVDLDQTAPPMNEMGVYAPVDATNQEDWSSAVSGPEAMFGDMSMYTFDQSELLPPSYFDMVTQQMPG